MRYTMSCREAVANCKGNFVAAVDARDGCGKKRFNVVLGLQNHKLIVLPIQV